MKAAWVWLYLLAGLLGGLGIGYLLGMRAVTVRAPSAETIPEVGEPLPVAASADPVLRSQLDRAEARTTALDRELATLKVEFQALQAEHQRTSQESAGLRSELDRARETNSRLRDDLARAQRALTESSPRSPSPPSGAPAPAPDAPVEIPTRLLQVDAAHGIVALDAGSEAGMSPGTRWRMRGEAGAVVLELTEVRVGFSIARLYDAEAGFALELASGKSYLLTPLP